MVDLAILNGMVWVDHAFSKQNIYVKDEKIVSLSKEVFEAHEIIDATGKYVIPGLIDPHVHFALGTGAYRSVDDFYSGSVAAAFGGVTTFIDFLDPTANAKDLEQSFQNRLAMAKDAVIDYRFHATIKQPDGPLVDYVDMMAKLGLSTVKLFTTYSNSGRRTNDETIHKLLTLSRQGAFTVLAHIENDEMIDLNPTFHFSDLGRSRPSAAESTEALKLLQFVQETQGYLYMVHCSSGNTLDQLIRFGKAELHRHFFVESCPHYFVFNQDIWNTENGNLYTMAPPLRSSSEQSKLCSLIDQIDTIGTDHCAYNASSKQQVLLAKMPLGIGGIEHSFVVMHTLFGDGVIDKMSSRVAKIHGLHNKGRIALGMDADFAMFEITKPYPITNSHTAADHDIFVGTLATTKMVRTIVRGTTVMMNQTLYAHQGLYQKGGKCDD